MRAASPGALTAPGKIAVRETFNRDRFQDQSLPEIYAKLPDEERYLCSWRTV